MTKVHEPILVIPVAVEPLALMENAGVAVALVNVIVVGVVVPKLGTPPGKVKGSPKTAAAVLADTATGGRLLDTIDVVMGVESPPPQAAKAAETSTVKNNLLALIMEGLY